MSFYKILMVSVLSLILVEIDAWAENAPVVDLNTPSDSATLLSPSSGAADTARNSSTQEFAPDALEARKSLSTAERINLLEQQLNNFTQMNLLAKIDSLEQRINQLNGQLEEQAHAISQLKEQEKKTPQPSQNLDSKPLLPEMPKVTAPPPQSAENSADILSDNKKKDTQAIVNKSEAEKTAPSNSINLAETAVIQNKSPAQSVKKDNTVASTTDSDNKAYQAAFELMVKKKNTAAIVGFKTFLKNYPNSNYTPSVHYWLGELYSSGNMNALADKEFSVVIKQYSTHNKVPDAMFKLAVIHDDAGQHLQAKKEFQTIIKQFPNSTAAKLAKMRLQSN